MVGVLPSLSDRLLAAQIAYDKLMLGGGIVRVRDQNGEEVQYQPGNAGRLAAYIENLQRQLGQLTVDGPARAYF